MSQSVKYAISVQDVDATSIGLVGGKGANLGELTRAQLPVPYAFCVTTDAYRDFIRDNNLSEVIGKELKGLNYDDVVQLGERAGRIREKILTAVIPGKIEQAVRTAYSALEDKLGKDLKVAVRSSATAEDLPGMSFAGQQDTYLSISGADNVLQHVKRCWGSLWTDRAISYRHKQGFKHEDVLLAVVVQEMFPSEVAGVMFTANPITSNFTEMMLNTSWGLGEAIVSGRVNPDQYTIAKNGLKIVDKRIHEKKAMTVARKDGQGSEEIEVPEKLVSAETLSDQQVQELAKIGLRIEDHYGFPQDIEWGFSRGRFAILQSREITAADLDFPDGMEAFQSPAALRDLRDERWVWSRGYSDEVQTGPSTPYHYSVLEHRMTILKHRFLRYTETDEFIGYRDENFEDIPLYRWYGARAYYNLEFEKERIRRFIPPFARDDQALWPFPAEEREQIRNMPFNWPRFLWLMLKLHVTNPKISVIETPQHVIENLKGWVDATAAAWKTFDMENASVREIFDFEMKARGKSQFFQNVVLPFTIYLFVLPAGLKKLCESWLDDTDSQLYNCLVSGLSTKTSEENLAIWKLSRAIKKHPKLTEIVVKEPDQAKILKAMKDSPDGQEFLGLLDKFIETYGHRGGAERDAYHPRYYHRPEMVFNPIKPMIKLDDDDSPEQFDKVLVERMKKTKSECRAKLDAGPLGFIRGPFFTWFVNLVQEYCYYRDFERFYNDRDMARPRDFLGLIGRRFVGRGLLEDVEDIHFLGRHEILDADEGRMNARDSKHRVRARRRVYDKYSKQEPPKFIRGWEFFEDNRLPDDGQGLRGIGASSGTVTGRARVCRKLDEISKVQKGDILVTIATDPGWTTVFSIVGGVVVETGGVVAHAVMISREYGIPCVANLTAACEQIPDGATITVDGRTGRVLILDEAGA